ncbi:hypothetical protein SMICM17S_06313 [Streptomyces microflavus]
MCFDFIGMQRMYLSMARGEAGPLAAALRERPGAPRDAHWATFVRNHDELTLDKLDDDERAEVFAAFGPDEDMQLYGRGLRRRLPPMVEGDRRRVELAYSLLFTLPGTPVLFYGEEIGMGENLTAEGRQAVRTPMQWTPDKGGGFSTADADALPNPVVQGAFGPRQVNVHDQAHDPDSLFRRMRTLIERYRETPNWPGERSKCSTRTIRACWPTSARFRKGRCWRCTTSPAARSPRRRASRSERRAPAHRHLHRRHREVRRRRPRPHRAGAVRLSLATRPPLNPRRRSCHGHGSTLQSPATTLMGALPATR